MKIIALLIFIVSIDLFTAWAMGCFDSEEYVEEGTKGDDGRY